MSRWEPTAAAEVETLVEVLEGSPEVLAASDLFSMEMPESESLVEGGQLPEHGASLEVGPPKSGKTLDAVQKAISVATGRAVYGEYRVLKPGPCMIIEADDPAGARSIKTILERCSAPKDSPLYVVPRVPYEIGPDLFDWMGSQIAKRSLRLLILDSYTSTRASRARGGDIVKQEQADFAGLDELGKRANCAILVIHHTAKGSAGLDWSMMAAGTFAVTASTESQTFIQRFPEFDGAAPERLVRFRSRHATDLEMVLRFRPETLDYEHVLAGGAAALYPLLAQIRSAFGEQTFSPKELSHATGVSRATAHRQIERLYRADAVRKRGHGEYVLVAAVRL